MSEKVSLTSEQIAPIVHDAFADLAKNINERGAPALAIAGELLKLGAEWAIQEEGKVPRSRTSATSSISTSPQ